MNSEQFLEQLHDDLLAAEARLAAAPPRRRRLRAAIAAVVAGAAGLAGILVWSGQPVGAGLELLRQGDELLIRLTDVETRPEDIEAAAEEAGIDIQVEEVPVGPSNVGRFINYYENGTPEYLTVDGSDPTSAFMGFRVPVDFDGTIRLNLGRRAADGEMWISDSWATSKGEPLECERIFERPLAEVLELVDGLDLDRVRVWFASEGRFLDEAEIESHADATVVWVTNSSDRVITIAAADDLAALPPQSPPPRDGCE